MLQGRRLVDSIARAVHYAFRGRRKVVDVRDVYHGRVYRVALDDDTLLAAKTVSSAARFESEVTVLEALNAAAAPVPRLYHADGVNLLLVTEWCRGKSLLESSRNAYELGSRTLQRIVEGIARVQIALRDMRPPPLASSDGDSDTYSARVARNAAAVLLGIGRTAGPGMFATIGDAGEGLSRRLTAGPAVLGPSDAHPGNVMIADGDVRFLDFALLAWGRPEARFAEYLGLAPSDPVALGGLMEAYARSMAPPHGSHGFREALSGHWFAYQLGLAQALLELAGGKRPSDRTFGWLATTEVHADHDERIALLDATVRRIKRHEPCGEPAVRLHRLLVRHL